MYNKTKKRRFNGSRPKQKSKQNTKSIDTSHFVKTAKPVDAVEYKSEVNFADMPLHAKLKQSIANKGYTSPTEIQSKTIQQLISGEDLVGIANTGTGKTGAFLIPIIEQLLTRQFKFQSLIVLPTRELALQVEEEFKSLTKHLNFSSCTLIGGTNVRKDILRLRQRNDLVIGTPGRILDMMQQKALKLQVFEVLVLDEFDRMLDMGFIRDVEKINAVMKHRRQTMLFSATNDPKQKHLIEKFVQNPVNVQVSSGTTSTDSVEQELVTLNGRDKFEVFKDLISNQGFTKVLVFAETKRMVDRISKRLNKSGIHSDMIHGDKSQNYRVSALNKFKSGKIKILVATDVAARGIDISDITHVINYQPPRSLDSYIHRIGRTGRAGRTGHAYTFV